MKFGTIYPPEGYSFTPFDPCDSLYYEDEPEYQEPDYCEINDCREEPLDYCDLNPCDDEAEDSGEYVEPPPADAGGEDGSSYFEECDPAYPDFCIPPVWVYGDLECEDIDGWGFTVYDPDPHWFDDDWDGIGCEWP